MTVPCECPEGRAATAPGQIAYASAVKTMWSPADATPRQIPASGATTEGELAPVSDSINRPSYAAGQAVGAVRGRTSIRVETSSGFV